jgi:hypothetical protein
MRHEEADGALRLRAEDVDDLAVISTCLQDALIAVGDIAYLPQDKSFVLVANRFRWEADRRAATGAEGCEGVLYRGFRRGERERILSLLAVRPEREGDRGGGAIHLDFSGGAGIRLTVGRILCRLKDVGLPWPTTWRPAHDLGERP